VRILVFLSHIAVGAMDRSPMWMLWYLCFELLLILLSIAVSNGYFALFLLLLGALRFLFPRSWLERANYMTGQEGSKSDVTRQKNKLALSTCNVRCHWHFAFTLISLRTAVFSHWVFFFSFFILFSIVFPLHIPYVLTCIQRMNSILRLLWNGRQYDLNFLLSILF